MYIPRNATELIFEPYTATVNNQPVIFTAQQQSDAFEQFIENSPYLRKHRGEYAERNAALTPWLSRLDMRFLQDFYVQPTGSNTRHTLQVSVDLLNLPNLLNKQWGIKQGYLVNNPLLFRSVGPDNQPIYRLQQLNGALVTEPFQTILNTTSTWSLQLGLRYMF